jgi:two-component system chemotaxis sensor kinase CheA
LAKVARLERVPAGDIEKVGGESVLQLRGELTPVLTLDGAAAPLPGCERFQPLLILAGEDGPLALAVEEIVDVVEERLEIELASDARPGVLGAAVVGGVAVEVLDLDFWRAAAPRRRRKRRAA